MIYTMTDIARRFGEEALHNIMLEYVREENRLNGRVTGGKPPQFTSSRTGACSADAVERRQRIVELLAAGKNQREIAEILGITRSGLEAIIRRARASGAMQ